MKTTYQTPARRAVVEFFSAHPDRHFTAEQLCTLLCDTAERRETDASAPKRSEFIGKSTVYRQLSRLCGEGLLRRFEDIAPDGGAVHVYQWQGEGHCEQHFHLKCLSCGRVYHLECDQTQHLLAHLDKAHAFAVDCGSSILYGTCAACAGGKG